MLGRLFRAISAYRERRNFLKNSVHAQSVLLEIWAFEPFFGVEMASFERYLCWCLIYFFCGVWGFAEVVARPSEGLGEFEVVLEEKRTFL